MSRCRCYTLIKTLTIGHTKRFIKLLFLHVVNMFCIFLSKEFIDVSISRWKLRPDTIGSSMIWSIFFSNWQIRMFHTLYKMHSFILPDTTRIDVFFLQHKLSVRNHLSCSRLCLGPPHDSRKTSVVLSPPVPMHDGLISVAFRPYKKLL